jgi:hypothetical protein
MTSESRLGKHSVELGNDVMVIFSEWPIKLFTNPNPSIITNTRDNIKMGLNAVGWESVDWIHLTQNLEEWWAHGNKVVNLQII